MLPELEKKLKKQLITWNCAACRFKNILRLWNILFRLQNILISFYFISKCYVVITVKLKFIIFSWIGLVISL